MVCTLYESELSSQGHTHDPKGLALHKSRIPLANHKKEKQYERLKDHIWTTNTGPGIKEAELGCSMCMERTKSDYKTTYVRHRRAISTQNEDQSGQNPKMGKPYKKTCRTIFGPWSRGQTLGKLDLIGWVKYEFQGHKY